MVELIVVGIAAFLTSILSAVAGLGGGVILLLVIAQFVAPTIAIPIQGAIQLVSNGSRAVLLQRSIAWPIVGWSSMLLLPGSFLGVAIATSVPDDAVRVMLAAFVIVLAWRPQWLKLRRPAGATADPGDTDLSDEGQNGESQNGDGQGGEHHRGEGADRTQGKRPMLLALGAATGLLNSTAGASGPVTSPFFKAVTATHVAFVATAAATQVAAHAAKLVAFTSGRWRVADHVGVIAVGITGVVVGSWVGTRLLGRTSTEHLDVVFKIVLTALAIRLIVTVTV